MKPIVLPGLLIEYLVVGSMSLIWLMLLAGPAFDAAGKDIPALYLVAVAPSIYGLGMIVEFLALCLVSFPPKMSIKAKIRKEIRSRQISISADDPGSEMLMGEQTTRRQIKLLVDAMEQGVPQLAEEVSMRSSRDRIARGTWMNCLIAALVLYLLPEPDLPAIADRATLLTIALAGFAATAFMWVYFEANSYAYELRVASILEERADETAANP